MRRCKIVTWILITVNFALGAPTAVRDRLEMSLDVDVAEGGTATSQKRYDELFDEWSTTNGADRSPISILSDLEVLWDHLGEEHIDWEIPLQAAPESPGSSESVDSNRPDDAPSNPGTPLPHPGSPDGNIPSLPGSPADHDTLSSTGHQPTPPQSPTDGPPLPPLPHPGLSGGRLPSSPGWLVDHGTLSTGHQPTLPQSPTSGSHLPFLPHPELSDDPFPQPGWSVDPDTLSSTGHQPTPPQSPRAVSSLPPLRRPGTSENSDRFLSPPGNLGKFLDVLLKGKIVRRISGSGTVSSTQRDPRSTSIPNR